MSASEIIEPTTESNSNAGYRNLRDWRWFWASLFLMTVPMLIHYFIWNWQYEQYHFFPLVIIAVAGLAYSRFDGVLYGPRGWIAWSAIALAAASVVGALALDTPWLSAVAFVLVGTAMLALLRGPSDASLVGLALPLWLLIRLPLGYDQLIVIRLQSLTTELSSVLLDVVRIPHALSGNVIQLASRELFVAEACSGIQSVFTLAFVACLMISISRRPLLLAPIYFIIACVLAVAANVLRVSAVAMGDVWFEMDLASGWRHEMVGYAALAIGIGLLLSFDQLVAALMHPLEASDFIEEFNPLVSVWNWFAESHFDNSAAGSYASEQRVMTSQGRPISIGAFGLSIAISSMLFVSSCAMALTRVQPEHGGGGMFAAMGPVMEPSPTLFNDLFETLQVISHESVRKGENPRLGENADVWSCDIGGIPAQLVLSQTYNGWHEFCYCYEINGWKLLNREIESLGDEGAKTPIAVALFANDDTGFGQLFYGAVSISGDTIEPPAMLGRLSSRFLGNDDPRRAQNPLLMFQLWIAGDEKLTPALKSKVKSDFSRAIDRLALQLQDDVAENKLTEDRQADGQD